MSVIKKDRFSEDRWTIIIRNYKPIGCRVKINRKIKKVLEREI